MNSSPVRVSLLECRLFSSLWLLLGLSLFRAGTLELSLALFFPHALNQPTGKFFCRCHISSHPRHLYLGPSHHHLSLGVFSSLLFGLPSSTLIPRASYPHRSRRIFQMCKSSHVLPLLKTIEQLPSHSR